MRAGYRSLCIAGNSGAISSPGAPNMIAAPIACDVEWKDHAPISIHTSRPVLGHDLDCRRGGRNGCRTAGYSDGWRGVELADAGSCDRVIEMDPEPSLYALRYGKTPGSHRGPHD